VVTTHAKTVAVVWGEEAPAVSIGYGAPMWEGDSGFSILFADAPSPEDLEDVPVSGSLPEGITLVHLACLIDDDPDLGRGLDIAREHGVAELDESGEWVVGDVSQLERA
jgi:hypothetical protein